MITEIVDTCVLNNIEALVLTGSYIVIFIIMAFYLNKLSSENYKLRLKRMNDDVNKALLEECMRHARQVDQELRKKTYDKVITD